MLDAAYSTRGNNTHHKAPIQYRARGSKIIEIRPSVVILHGEQVG